MSPFKLARLYRNPQPPLPHEGCPSWLAHEVTNTGSDRAQLANIDSRAKDAIGVDKLEAVADRGYYSGVEILACDKAGIAVTLPWPTTSGLEARGASANRTLSISATRTCIVVRPMQISAKAGNNRQLGWF